MSTFFFVIELLVFAQTLFVFVLFFWFLSDPQGSSSRLRPFTISQSIATSWCLQARHYTGAQDSALQRSISTLACVIRPTMLLGYPIWYLHELFVLQRRRVCFGNTCDFPVAFFPFFFPAVSGRPGTFLSGCRSPNANLSSPFRGFISPFSHFFFLRLSLQHVAGSCWLCWTFLLPLTPEYFW